MSDGTESDATGEDWASFRQRVMRIVESIPPGFVTTYGVIATAAGKPRCARQVGMVLSRAPADWDAPCHRVVNHAGFLSGGWGFGHPIVMKDLLLEEGVEFRAEYVVDLRGHLWIPD